MTNRLLTLEEKHAFAMDQGLWQCHACPTGWMQYFINADKNVCAVCGYKGGPLPQKQANGQSESTPAA